MIEIEYDQNVYFVKEPPRLVMAVTGLFAVLVAWTLGEGNLLGLLWAWWEVVSGRVSLGEIQVRVPRM